MQTPEEDAYMREALAYLMEHEALDETTTQYAANYLIGMDTYTMFSRNLADLGVGLNSYYLVRSAMIPRTREMSAPVMLYVTTYEAYSNFLGEQRVKYGFA